MGYKEWTESGSACDQLIYCLTSYREEASPNNPKFDHIDGAKKQKVKDLFADLLDPKIFMQYCCPWLLPPLILRNDTPNLNLASKVACKPLSLLVKDFFAQIFAVCFAVSCGVSSDKEAGEVALQSSILHIANISEHERDELIKKNTVPERRLPIVKVQFSFVQG